MSNCVPIFCSDASLGDSILTCVAPHDELEVEEPISILTIIKKYQLKQIFLCDTFFSNFVTTYKECNKLNCQLIFGVKFKIVSNAKDQSEESQKTESSVRVWMKNSEGYKDLIKLYSTIHANKDNFYYYSRGDWKILQDFWTDNLILTIPFYSSFLANNFLKYEWKSIPEFGKIKPIFEISQMGLPFDNFIENKTSFYAKDNNYEILNTDLIYYYAKNDFEAFLTNKCIHARTTMEKPELEFMSSDKFCFENYCTKNEREFIKV